MVVGANSTCYDEYYYCYYATIGQSVWCSIFPFIAAFTGIGASNNPTPSKIRLLMGFSIVGAVFAALLSILELAFLTSYYSSVYALQWTIFSASALNMILLIVSASYSCCMMGCGCCNEQQPGVAYATYQGPAAPVYVVSAAGAQGNQPQYVTVNPSQVQQLNGNPVYVVQPQMMQNQTFQPQVNPQQYAPPPNYGITQQQEQQQQQQSLEGKI